MGQLELKIISAQLLPCPFCGKAAAVREMSDSGGRQILLGCYISSRECSIMPMAYGAIENLPAMIEQWNTRAAIPPLPQTRSESHRDSEGAETSAPLGLRDPHGGERIPGPRGGVSGENAPLGSEEWRRSLTGLARTIAEGLERWADSCRQERRRGNGGN